MIGANSVSTLPKCSLINFSLLPDVIDKINFLPRRSLNTVASPGLLTSLKSGNYDEEITINELKFKFKPLSYKQINQVNSSQFEIQAVMNSLENINDDAIRQAKTSESMTKLTELSISFVAESIEHITSPSAFVVEKEYILDFLKNCDKQTFDALRKSTIDLRESSEIKPLRIKCVNCANEYDQTLVLNATDFFD